MALFWRKKEENAGPTANSIIWVYSRRAGYSGAVNLLCPHLDTLIIGPLWVEMGTELANHYEISLKDEDLLKIVGALSGSLGMFGVGYKTAAWMLTWTGVAAIPMTGLNMALNGAVTFAAGQAMAKSFGSSNVPPAQRMGEIVKDFLKMLPRAPLHWAKAAKS